MPVGTFQALSESRRPDAKDTSNPPSAVCLFAPTAESFVWALRSAPDASPPPPPPDVAVCFLPHERFLGLDPELRNAALG